MSEARDRFDIPNPEDAEASVREAELVKALDEAIEAKNEKDIADDLQKIIDEF
ncbi:hypothetical protein BH09ACT5_BH09ACT5_21300 [soil metagenome]